MTTGTNKPINRYVRLLLNAFDFVQFYLYCHPKSKALQSYPLRSSFVM